MEYKGDHKKGAKGMDKIREKRKKSLGKLGSSISNFFSKKKKKKADAVNLDKKKTEAFMRGFSGKN